MSNAPKSEFVSAEDYLLSEENARNRNEYIEGWVRAMLGGSVRHNQVKVNCTYAIVIRRAPHGFLRETYDGLDSVIMLPFLGVTLEFRDVYDGVEFSATCVQEPDEEYEIA